MLMACVLRDELFFDLRWRDNFHETSRAGQSGLTWGGPVRFRRAVSRCAVFSFLGVGNTDLIVAGGASAVMSGKADRAQFLKPSMKPSMRVSKLLNRVPVRKGAGNF